MEKSKAFGVVKAAVRMKLAAERARARMAEEEAAAGQAELGDGDMRSPFLSASAQEAGASARISVNGSFAGSPSARTPSLRAPPSLASRLRDDMLSLQHLVTSSYVNVLLLAVPFAFLSEYRSWGAISTFGLSFASLVPLALILGDVTEDLAKRFGNTMGGLINATFGNVVELILSIAALQKGLYVVVATSLLGSILSNLRLVLGCCFFFGGLRYKLQTFNAVANKATSSVLFMSVMAIVLPTAASQMVPDISDAQVLAISRGSAIAMLAIYACHLLFQLHTHSDIFAAEEPEEEGAEEPMLSLPAAIGALSAITLVVAFASEFLTGSLEEVSAHTGLGQAFMGMIVLPIAGNACEHITAVIVARNNNMDLALAVAVGSSIQIALFAVPFVVMVAWAMGRGFSLALVDPFSALILTLSVIHANCIMADASSHWLMGIMLIAAYAIVALTYLYQ